MRFHICLKEGQNETVGIYPTFLAREITQDGTWYDVFFIWEHGKESLEKFLNRLYSFHSTIKFSAGYSKETIIFLDVNIRLVDGELMTDLFVEPTNTHQFLDPSKFFSPLSLQERNTI